MKTSKTPSIRVVIVENEADLLKHLGALVDSAPGLDCVGTYHSATDAISQLADTRPDVILLDLGLPGLKGQDAIPQIHARVPKAQILVLSIHDDADWLFPALEAGASGYLTKPASPAAILRAIRDIRAGGSPMNSQIARKVLSTFHRQGEHRRALDTLTEREKNVLNLVAKGLTNGEVAAHLGTSTRTIGSHLQNIYAKLHVHTRTEAAARLLSS